MTFLEQKLIEHLPYLRGKLRADTELAKVNWFRVGGTAEFMFKPEDVADLAYFVACRPSDIPVTVLGVGSNLLVRDGGIEGAVIRLGLHFATCEAQGDRLTVGAGCLNSNAVAVAQSAGIGNLEFLKGIPGTIGGALAMNAGAYGTETRDILIEAEAVDPLGRIHTLTVGQLHYSYRRCGLPEGWIFTRATLQGKHESPQLIAERLKKITRDREETQPVRTRTGGSTFKNPEGRKAWQLIDKAGCRGLAVGGAVMSEKHCNFMINSDSATSEDLEMLGEEVRRRVLDDSGVALEWEIRRIGRPLTRGTEKAVA